MQPFLTGHRRTTFLAVAARVVPGIATLDDAASTEALGLIERQLAGRSKKMRRELALFLGFIRWAPVGRYGRTFDGLDESSQDTVMGWLQDAPLTKVRAGFWGLKTLAFLGYYGRPAVGDTVRYHPSRDGNVVLHAR